VAAGNITPDESTRCELDHLQSDSSAGLFNFQPAFYFRVALHQTAGGWMPYEFRIAELRKYTKEHGTQYNKDEDFTRSARGISRYLAREMYTHAPSRG